jgi:predicted secreted Zn-dependent protease
MIKYVNGIAVEMTQEEINKHNDLALSSAEQLEEALNFLRAKRNSLLAQTDYLALSDQTMSAEMTTYRQALRDITNGLTIVADVEAVVFPEKPEV